MLIITLPPTCLVVLSSVWAIWNGQSLPVPVDNYWCHSKCFLAIHYVHNQYYYQCRRSFLSWYLRTGTGLVLDLYHNNSLIFQNSRLAFLLFIVTRTGKCRKCRIEQQGLMMKSWLQRWDHKMHFRLLTCHWSKAKVPANVKCQTGTHLDLTHQNLMKRICRPKTYGDTMACWHNSCNLSNLWLLLLPLVLTGMSLWQISCVKPCLLGMHYKH